MVEFQVKMAWYGTIPFGEEDMHLSSTQENKPLQLLAGSFVFDSALG
jgi:hypothetical protein